MAMQPKVHLGERLFKKAVHEARMLVFNPAFTLELYITGTLASVVMSVFLHASYLSVFLPYFFFLLTLLTKHNTKWVKGFLYSMG